jgi:hypothetical protein
VGKWFLSEIRKFDYIQLLNSWESGRHLYVSNDLIVFNGSTDRVVFANFPYNALISYGEICYLSCKSHAPTYFLKPTRILPRLFPDGEHGRMDPGRVFAWEAERFPWYINYARAMMG